MSFRPKRTPAIEAFWCDAAAATPELDPESEFTIFSFGDSQELCDHVLAETLAGRNQATASLRWDYDSRLPQAGDVAIVTDWAGAPRAVLATRRVDVVRYGDVDEDFARAEGYARDPLNEWREVHWAYFSRRCAELGRIVSLDMPIVCERFELVYPLAR
ncbi:MAG TPA: ASCH domain-containing protein [Dongiaceae bacterium]|jgi:uncharacterized protein YhfF|nr:ASCH domain-containing protein [Dongiaceae bacterium]